MLVQALGWSVAWSQCESNPVNRHALPMKRLLLRDSDDSDKSHRLVDLEARDGGVARKEAICTTIVGGCPLI